MTDHFKHSLKIIGIAIAVLLSGFLWMKHNIEKAVLLPPSSMHTKLAPDEKELVAFNERTHHVTITTSSGTVTMYARNPTVRIKKSGKVIVDRHLFGWEMRPIIGGGYSDATRAVFGVEPIYWGPFDASVLLGITLDRQYVFARPYVAGGYNCWSNLSLGVGINPADIKVLDIIVFVSVKL